MLFRRWPNIETAFGEYPVFARMLRINALPLWNYIIKLVVLEQTTTTPHPCPFKRVRGNPNKFKYPGHQAQRCPPNQIFNITICGCVNMQDNQPVESKFVTNITQLSKHKKCITFVQRWTSVEDVVPTFDKCYTNVLCLLGITQLQNNLSLIHLFKGNLSPLIKYQDIFLWYCVCGSVFFALGSL